MQKLALFVVGSLASVKNFRQMIPAVGVNHSAVSVLDTAVAK